jgi:cold shock CspA family protein
MEPLSYDNFETRAPMRGKVRKLLEGFGFIAGDDGLDYFFHWTGLQQTTKEFKELKLLDRVEGLVVDGQKGPRLIEVRVIDDRPPSHPSKQNQK